MIVARLQEILPFGRIQNKFCFCSLLMFVKLGRRVIIRRADIERLFEPQQLRTKPLPKADPTQITEWYTVQEVMEKYGLTRDGVYNLTKANKIPKQQQGRYVMLSKIHFDRLFQPTTKNRFQTHINSARLLLHLS